MSSANDYSQQYLRHREPDEELLETVITSLKLTKEMHLLDFGCGTGNYLLALQKRGFVNLSALDIDRNMRETAKNRTGVDVKAGSHLDIPFEDDIFDSVMLIAMIHFIDDLDRLFKNLYRVCKNNGRVVIVTQSHDQVDARFYNKYFPSLAGIDKRHYHELSAIIDTAEASGFYALPIQEYAVGTDLTVDIKYFNLIKDKSFYVLRRLPDDEFNEGLKQFEAEMEHCGGEFTAKFVGWTIITLQKGGML